MMDIEEAKALQQKCLDKMRKGGLEPIERMDCFDEFETTLPNADLVKEFYDVWAADYDKDMAVVEYKNPNDVAQVLAKLVDAGKAGTCKKEDLKILDLGAGTGVGGIKLVDLGFTNVDATDGSPGMLDMASKLGVYRTILPPEILIQGQGMKSVPPETYDVIVSSGSFYPFHLQGAHLKCFLDCVKTDGLIVISACPHNDEKIGLKPIIQELAKDGFIEIIEEVYVPKWYRKDDGTVWALKKLKRFSEQ